MEKNVIKFMEQLNMIGTGDLVVAGVSGGADSMCLLGILMKYQKMKMFDLVVVHINHGIRGEEANRDESYVREFCRENQIVFECAYVDVPALARKQGSSTEEAGRMARYKTFADIARRYQKPGQPYKIAVAHHKGDLAETVLFNLLRGSGLRGAAGIVPVNGNIIRPLLQCERGEIVEWLTMEGISYVEDSTNKELEYSRNRLRNVVLPYIEENINAGAGNNLCNFANIMGQAYSYLERQAGQVEAKVVRRYDGIVMLTEDFRYVEQILQGIIVHGVLAELLEAKRDITITHTQLVTGLFSSSTGAKISLIHGLTAKRGYKGIYLYKKGRDIYDVAEIRRLELGNIPLDCENQIRYETMDYEKNLKFPLNPYTKYFDCDKIKRTLCVRKKMPGDYLIMSGTGGKKTLKSYLIDQKVPRELREHLTVVADGSHVLWVVGMRDSAGCRVSEKTRKIMKIWYEGNTHCGGKEDGKEP